MITHYFGTDLSSAGHYTWDISKDGKGLGNRSLNFRETPFSPENISENLANGQVSYAHFLSSRFGYITVCAISGSCSDKRPGSKSVFWVYENISFEEIKNRILATPVCKEIIDKMPFTVLF